MQLPFKVRVPVRFRDIDALEHVNHAVYFTYLEVARCEYWFAFMGERSMRAFNFIVLKAECRYHSPVVLGETLIVRMGSTHIGNTSFTLNYEISEETSGRKVAEANTVQVMYDYTQKKPVHIPEAFRERIRRFEDAYGVE